MASERRYFDPEGFGLDAVALLEDPPERAAVALWLASWQVPESAASELVRDGGKHAWASWAKQRANERHLYRRRAALALYGEL